MNSTGNSHCSVKTQPPRWKVCASTRKRPTKSSRGRAGKSGGGGPPAPTRAVSGQQPAEVVSSEDRCRGTGAGVCQGQRSPNTGHFGAEGSGSSQCHRQQPRTCPGALRETNGEQGQAANRALGVPCPAEAGRPPTSSKRTPQQDTPPAARHAEPQVQWGVESTGFMAGA